MTLIIKDVGYGRTDLAVEVWVDYALTYTHRDGATERAQETANNCTGAIARLVTLLAEKGVLTAPEVHYVAKGYHDSDVVFEREDL